MNKGTVQAAQMARTHDGAHWIIYVVILGESEWPEVRLPVGDGIPSVARRSDVLASLGYVSSSAATRWEWIEGQSDDEPVHLIATHKVVPAEIEHPAGSSTRRS
ncbi:DUF6303 family protein [Streptomyces sp. NBC_01506]|uniref:DUF6303 family protein n=1 Tax=Streptomyces sp. NBC_01506 TaxID=2903887 RepID=UPI00386FAD56